MVGPWRGTMRQTNLVCELGCAFWGVSLFVLASLQLPKVRFSEGGDFIFSDFSGFLCKS